jgi:hypothetical protein
MSTTGKDEHRARWPEPDLIDVCSVCGTTAPAGDIERTSGWRWFNDGHSGLSGLCPSCPTPTSLLADAAPLLAA